MDIRGLGLQVLQGFRAARSKSASNMTLCPKVRALGCFGPLGKGTVHELYNPK